MYMKTLQNFTRIKTSKVLLLLAMIFASLSVHAQESVVVSIGEGDANYTYYPFATYYNYSLTEQIYTAEEIGMAGTIHSIAFYFSSSTSFDENGVKLYMKNVTRSAFASESDMVPLSVADLVWEGTFSVSGSGWVTITLDTPFDYVGDNLLVACFDGTSGYPGSGCNFSTFSTGTELSGIYWNHDSYCPDPYNTASGYEGHMTGTLYRNIIQLDITPAATPKPMMLKASNIAARVATLSWTSSNPNALNFQYQYKAEGGEWTTMATTTETSVNLTGLDLTTTYTFRVKVVYAAGESDFSIVTFTTKSACERPTGLTANAVGDLTYATLSWSENGESTAWVLQYDTDNDFTNPSEVTTGFVVEGTNVSCTLTGLTEQTYYARVKPACDTEGTLWSDIVEFVPSYASLVVNGGSSSTNSYVPIYGYQAASKVYSQFIIPSERLDALAGGSVKRFTFHTNNYYTVPNWGNAQFEVYVAEVDNTTFSTNTVVDWSTLTQVYSGSLVVSNYKMIVTLNDDFIYEGGNLLIGFKQTETGTGHNVSWYGVLGDANINIYGIEGYEASRANFLPRVTFGYIPTSYPRMTSIEEGTITSNSAVFSWTSPNSNVTGYAYQYKRLSETEWPAQWTSLNATTVTLSGLSQATDYRFRVKVLYGEHESVPFNVSFTTECGEFADVPFFENFDSYADGDMPRCWSRIVSDGYPKVFQYSTCAHSGENSLQFWKYNSASYPDQYAILPQMQNISDLRVRFYARRGDSNTASSVIVGVMTDPADASTFQEIATCDSEGGSYQKIKVSLASYTGGNGYIAFKTGSTPCYFYVDDITVEPIPDCEEPEELEVSNVEAHAATFGWTDSGNPNVWQIYVSTDNVMPEEPIAANLHSVNSHPATISGLAPVTEYYAWVRSNCGSSGYSPWSDPVSFTTGIACPQLIYWYYEEMSVAATYAQLHWYSDGQETAWQICLNGDEDHLIDADNNTFTITGLTPATEYTVKVRANCGGEDGYSEWSDEQWFTTDFCDPEDKCNISITTNSSERYGDIVFMSGEDEVAWLSLDEGLNDFALCPGVYDIVWRGNVDGAFAIYGSDGNVIYSTENAQELDYGDVLVDAYTHVCEGVCFPPRNLDVLATTTTATFTWEPVGEETEWKVQYDALYTTNTIDFDGLTELPDGWILYTAVEGDNVELGSDNGNACLHLTGVSVAAITIPVTLGGISSFDVKAIGEATTVSYYIGDSEYGYEDQQEIGTSEYQTITVSSQGYSGSGLLDIWINSGEVYIDNVQLMVPNGSYSNAEVTVQGTPSFVFDGLAPGTGYKARVKAICGQDDESGWKETTFTTPLCDDACRIRYTLGDSYGDGWNGAYISVVNVSDNREVAEITMEVGGQSEGNLSLCPDETYSFIWVSGEYDSECSFTIYGSDRITVIASHSAGDEFPGDGILLDSYAHECEGNDVFVVSYDNPYIETFEYGFWDSWTTIDYSGNGYHCDPNSWQIIDGVAGVSPGCYTSSYFCLQPVKVTPTTQLSFRAWFEMMLDCKIGDGSLLVSTDNGHSWSTLCSGLALGGYYVEEMDRDDFLRHIGNQSISLGAYSQYESIMICFKYQGYSNNNGGGIATLCVDNIRIYDPNVFTDGAKNASWSNASNWTQGVPTSTDWVLIDGNCDLDIDATVTSAIVGNGKTLTIQSGKTLIADQVTTTETSQLVINDGGQLRHNNDGLLATLEKEIEHYTVIVTEGNTKANGWYLVSFPVEVWNDTHGLYEGIHPSQVTNLTSNAYDLYRFNSHYVGKEWRNYKSPDNSDMFMSGLPTDGFLYANSGNNGQDVTLQFAGKVSSVQSEGNIVYLVYNEDNEAVGTWNLVGNPLLCEAYPLYGEEIMGGVGFDNKSRSSDWMDYGTMPYYRMNGDRTDFIVGEGAIQPLEGVFMQYDEYRSEVRFSSEPYEEQGVVTDGAQGRIVLDLTKGRATVIDRAEVRFGDGPMLGKLMLNSNNSNICIPQGGRKFSVVNMANEGEVPVNFKAAQNGVFTLSVKVNDTEMSYIHLIDNLTGVDVDLLESSSYTFDARTTDYASRFKLVFSGPSTGSGTGETFAFFNGSEWVITEEHAGATVQIIDVMGRIVYSRDGVHTVSTTGMAPGVYVMRLINGDEVKTQKVVVR